MQAACNPHEFLKYLNFQGTLIGVECGNSHYWGFMELGMGEQGIVNAGIRFKI